MEDQHLADGGTGNEYIVESILCHFSVEELRNLGKSGFPALYEDRHDNEVLYWVRWGGYGPEHDTLEPEEQLEGLKKLKEYKRRYGVLTERTPPKTDKRDYAFFLLGQKSVPVLRKNQWMARRPARSRKASSKNGTSMSKGRRPRKRPSTPASKELVSAGFELSDDDFSSSTRRKHENASPKSRKNTKATSRDGWSAVSARGTVTLESVWSMPEDYQRQRIHLDEPVLLNEGQNAQAGICGTAPTHIQPAETASVTNVLDASSESDGATESDRATEVTSKGGPERVCGDDASKQTTIEKDLYYLGTFAASDLSRKRQENGGLCQFPTAVARSNECSDKLNARNRASDTHKAPSSGACSLQPSLGRHTPLPPFDCCIDVHVELPFAPEAPPPIERVDNSQDSITDTPDAPLSSSNPFTNWIKNGSAPEPMSVATDNPPCPTGQDYEHAIPIDGLLATNAGCTRKPLKGILKKSANQVAGACPAESTLCLLTRQERHPLSVGAPRASNEDQGRSPPLARAGTLDRRLPHAQLEERVLTFCDPRNSSRYHCEVRDQRRLDWNTAMKYVRLVAESSDYSEGEDYEPVVFEESGKNSS